MGPANIHSILFPDAAHRARPRRFGIFHFGPAAPFRGAKNSKVKNDEFLSILAATDIAREFP